jgi:hypothetical protein
VPSRRTGEFPDIAADHLSSSANPKASSVAKNSRRVSRDACYESPRLSPPTLMGGQLCARDHRRSDCPTGERDS